MIQVAGTLIVQNAQYVVQKRDNIPTIADPGMYSLWGGRVEDDETPLQAAVRELQEETGVVVQARQLIYLTKFEDAARSSKSLGQTVEIFLYALELAEDVQVRCFEGEKLVHVGSLTALPDTDVTSYLKQAVELYERQKS